MNPTLFKAIVALVPTSAIVIGSFLLLGRHRSAATLVLAVGAVSVLVVILAHVCEALHLMPWMQWGMEHSAGHYVDLVCAALGLTLFPLGYFAHAICDRAGR